MVLFPCSLFTQTKSRVGNRTLGYAKREVRMKVAAIFSDNMVLQRDRETCVFGSGEEQEKIKVQIDGIETETTVENGKWLVMLPSHKAGGPYEMKITGRKDKKQFTNIMYGEVWFASGQSNMELEVQDADFGTEELLLADYKDIRYYNVIKTPYIDDEVLKKEASQSWHMCKNGEFRDMSAVAYFFAKKTYEQLKIPIGIIDCYQGGTSISCWLSMDNLSKTSDGIHYLEEYERIVADKSEEDYAKELEAYQKELEIYNQKIEHLKVKAPNLEIKEIKKRAGEYPWPPPMGRQSLYRPCGLYETMVKRVCPYTTRGFLYYQGEEDAGRAKEYDKLLLQLICQFRYDWRDSTLPFIIVQLPMFIAKNEPEDYSWAKIRQAQEFAYHMAPYTGLTVLADLGEYDNIHPTDKKTPGTRLALQVLQRIYKEPVDGEAMFFSYAKQKNEKLCLFFSNTYGEIQLMENELLDIREAQIDGGPVGFELSGDGQLWYPAKGRIKGEQIEVWSEQVKVPEFIRYGYFNYGKVNIYNRVGLPLAPFYEAV